MAGATKPRSRKKGLILGRLRPFQFPQKGHLHWNDNNSKNNGLFLAIFILHSWKYSSFYLKTIITVSIFTDQGEKKTLTLIISKLRLARRSALSTFLREADGI